MTTTNEEIGDLKRFDRAKEGLTTWRAYAGVGARIFPDLPVRLGDSVLVVVRFGPVQVVPPCRIIYVIDEANRFGFGYGTLPGHPECGEESFVVERGEDATVFRITAFSRPAELLTRVGGPISRQIQVQATRRYLQGLATYVSSVVD